MSVKFTVVKKNQILAGAVTLMLVTAGYLNYKYDPTKAYDVEVTGMIEEKLGDAVLVDSQGIIQNPIATENETNYIVSQDGLVPVFQNQTDITNLLDTSGEKANNQANGGETENSEFEEEKVFKEIEDYFISTRIDRTNHYAEEIESYEVILLDANVNDEQKNKAQNEIERINGIRNSIMIAENLIALKGFDEAIVLVNENSINVVVAADSLSASQVAQIQSIIMNEFSIDIDKVHIISYD